jgi:chromosome partitioning protein
MATKIISIANQKGGVGKSTATMLLAAALAKQKGKRVLIVDTDQQKTVEDTVAIEKQMYPDGSALVDVEATPPQFVVDLLKLRGEKYDVVFLDVPRITEQSEDSPMVFMLYLCDAVLIPVLGSQIDAMSTKAFMAIIRKLSAHKDATGLEFSFYGFMNRVNARKENEEAFHLMESLGVPMMKNTIKDLKIFSSPSLFTSVLDSAEGRRRFEPFFKEFCKLLKIK